MKCILFILLLLSLSIVGTAQNFRLENFTFQFNKAGEGSCDTTIKYSSYFSNVQTSMIRHLDTITLNFYHQNSLSDVKSFIIDSVLCKSAVNAKKQIIYQGKLLLPSYSVDNSKEPLAFSKEKSQIILFPNEGKMLLLSNSKEIGLLLYSE